MFRCTTLHRQAALISRLLKTTCCYTAVIYGYYGSYVMKYKIQLCYIEFDTDIFVNCNSVDTQWQ